jgi:hypothetical protein
VCECAWQQRVRPLTPDLPPYIRNPLSFKNIMIAQPSNSTLSINESDISLISKRPRRIAWIVLEFLSFSRMCNFPKDSIGVTNFSAKVTFSDSTAGTVPSGLH